VCCDLGAKFDVGSSANARVADAAKRRLIERKRERPQRQ
jgi:hypothetical protein